MEVKELGFFPFSGSGYGASKFDGERRGKDGKRENYKSEVSEF